jgi:hypothetical protein
LTSFLFTYSMAAGSGLFAHLPQGLTVTDVVLGTESNRPYDRDQSMAGVAS